METEARRKQVLEVLRKSDKPVTGTSLAERFDVSRQVIVTDIAILRARGNDIIATPQGYVMNSSRESTVSRTIAVKHSDDFGEIERELNIIVDNGARVNDVIVEHPVYGELRGLLMLESRRDVREFLSQMRSYKAEPLLVLTGGIHLHTLQAADEETLNAVEQALQGAGFIAGKEEDHRK